jgi:alkanesulfonate monooxygenase SsuD/methylene tetrahydromethanopterin reductase-like flavin-dependent oxidoreductase (luciferase family)
MRLGIGLPNTLAWATDRRLMLDWARLADEAGFHLLAVIDKPNYDSWEPLATLAGVTGVTERARLATLILQLPNRNETLVAKQAAVVDQLSGGRLDLGVAVGGREDDYDVLGAAADFRRRGPRLEEQVGRIRELWAAARASDLRHGVLGPPPVQAPGPPIWVGAVADWAVERALRIGDGFVFGAVGIEAMVASAPGLRERAAALGKPDFQLIGTAYVAVDDDPAAALEAGRHSLLRYYGDRIWADPERILHYGPAEVIAEAVEGYARAGLDALVLHPEIPSLNQVEELARWVLPRDG